MKKDRGISKEMSLELNPQRLEEEYSRKREHRMQCLKQEQTWYSQGTECRSVELGRSKP